METGIASQADLPSASLCDMQQQLDDHQRMIEHLTMKLMHESLYSDEVASQILHRYAKNQGVKSSLWIG